MKKGVLVYLSGPITPKGMRTAEDNVVQGLAFHIALANEGIPNIAPQLVGMFPSAWNVKWTTWIDFDLAILDFCTHVLMLPGWRESRGANMEYDYALTKGIPIFESLPALREALKEV